MKKIISWIFFGIFIIFVFHPFFSFREIAGGDFPYFHQEQLAEFSFPPYSWITNQRLGIPIVSPWIDIYVSAIIVLFVNSLHIPWTIVQTVFFFLLAVVLSLFSSYYLFRTIWKKGSVIASLIYTCNTYFFLILSGGQVGIFLAYAIAPLILASFIKVVGAFKDKKRDLLQISLLAGLFLSVQVLFDIRIAYITMVSIGLYALFVISYKLSEVCNTLVLLLYLFVIPIGIMVLLHASWLLPLLVYKQNPLDTLGAVYSSQEVVKFFSFASFPQTISLLHPNWWENIFGKIGFMKPEFLIVPILAFSSLLFLNSKFKIQEFQNKKAILFFALLGLIGAFFAKGTNEPFGFTYIWLFEHLPGFVMFRDPTKWYILVALAYSVLIPISIWKIYYILSQHTKFSIFNFQNVFLLLTTVYLLLLIHPVFQNKLTGTFQARSLPKEYIQLKEFILSDQTFSRSLWIPYFQRFGISTQQHPQVSGYQLFRGMSDWDVLKTLQKPSMKELIQDAAIRYIIIPYDSEREIFLDDRKYSDKEYQKFLKGLEAIPYLTKVTQFGKIVVFQVRDPKGHFWFTKSNASVSILSETPTSYSLNLKNVKRGDQLIFSETYNPHWQAKISGGNTYISSKPYNNRFNSFFLSENGDYQITISYLPQELVFAGTMLQIVTLASLGVFFIFSRKKF